MFSNCEEERCCKHNFQQRHSFLKVKIVWVSWWVVLLDIEQRTWQCPLGPLIPLCIEEKRGLPAQDFLDINLVPHMFDLLINSSLEKRKDERNGEGGRGHAMIGIDILVMSIFNLLGREPKRQGASCPWN